MGRNQDRLEKTTLFFDKLKIARLDRKFGVTTHKKGARWKWE